MFLLGTENIMGVYLPGTPLPWEHENDVATVVADEGSPLLLPVQFWLFMCTVSPIDTQ